MGYLRSYAVSQTRRYIGSTRVGVFSCVDLGDKAGDTESDEARRCERKGENRSRGGVCPLKALPNRQPQIELMVRLKLPIGNTECRSSSLGRGVIRR